MESPKKQVAPKNGEKKKERGRNFTLEEDLNIVMEVEKYGRNWGKVLNLLHAKHVCTDLRHDDDKTKLAIHWPNMGKKYAPMKQYKRGVEPPKLANDSVEQHQKKLQQHAAEQQAKERIFEEIKERMQAIKSRQVFSNTSNAPQTAAEIGNELKARGAEQRAARQEKKEHNIALWRSNSESLATISSNISNMVQSGQQGMMMMMMMMATVMMDSSQDQSPVKTQMHDCMSQYIMKQLPSLISSESQQLENGEPGAGVLDHRSPLLPDPQPLDELDDDDILIDYIAPASSERVSPTNTSTLVNLATLASREHDRSSPSITSIPASQNSNSEDEDVAVITGAAEETAYEAVKDVTPAAATSTAPPNRFGSLKLIIDKKQARRATEIGQESTDKDMVPPPSKRIKGA